MFCSYSCVHFLYNIHIQVSPSMYNIHIIVSPSIYTVYQCTLTVQHWYPSRCILHQCTTLITIYLHQCTTLIPTYLHQCTTLIPTYLHRCTTFTYPDIQTAASVYNIAIQTFIVTTLVLRCPNLCTQYTPQHTHNLPNVCLPATPHPTPSCHDIGNASGADPLPKFYLLRFPTSQGEVLTPHPVG